MTSGLVRRGLRGRALIIVALLGTAPSLSGCVAQRATTRAALPTPVESSSLGPGDVFSLQIVGEKDLPQEYQVASDGTVDLPFLHQVDVDGLEPQELSRLVRQKLIEQQILTDPSVVVRVVEYRSKQISVLGQVKSPGTFPFQAGMTLIQAVSSAGGLNSIARGDRLRLTRRVRGGGSKTVTVDLEEINSGRSEDIPLQAGDRIYVEERFF